jgi:hypothetical protein
LSHRAWSAFDWWRTGHIITNRNSTCILNHFASSQAYTSPQRIEFSRHLLHYLFLVSPLAENVCPLSLTLPIYLTEPHFPQQYDIYAQISPNMNIKILLYWCIRTTFEYSKRDAIAVAEAVLLDSIVLMRAHCKCIIIITQIPDFLILLMCLSIACQSLSIIILICLYAVLLLIKMISVRMEHGDFFKGDGHGGRTENVVE